MVRSSSAIAELKALLSKEGPIDQAYCRRLVLRATSRMSDLQKAGRYADELGIRIAAADMAEILGAERQWEVEAIFDCLDEIEELSLPH